MGATLLSGAKFGLSYLGLWLLVYYVYGCFSQSSSKLFSFVRAGARLCVELLLVGLTLVALWTLFSQKYWNFLAQVITLFIKNDSFTFYQAWGPIQRCLLAMWHDALNFTWIQIALSALVLLNLLTSLRLLFSQRLAEQIRKLVSKSSKSYQDIVRAEAKYIASFALCALLLWGLCAFTFHHLPIKFPLHEEVLWGYFALFMLLRWYFSPSVKVRVNIKPFLSAFQALDRALILFLIPSTHLKLQAQKDKYTTLATQLQKDLLARQMEFRDLSVLKIPNNLELLLYNSTLGLLAQSIENIIKIKEKCRAKDVYTAFSKEPFLEFTLDRSDDPYLKQASKERAYELKEIYSQAHKEDPDAFVETLAQSVPNLSFAQYAIENQCYYLPFEKLDNYSACSSCGKLMPKNDIEGEYFCSQECKQTEQVCMQISDTLSPALEDQDFTAFYQVLKEDQERQFKRVTDILSGITINNIVVAQNWVELYKPLANASTGHGYMAEILNNRTDLSAGKNAIIVGDNNLKDGADRLVNGMEIQTKYCKSATRTFNELLNDNGEYRYYNKEGQAMVVEVPKEQYEGVVAKMKQSIQEGKVRGVSDPNEAYKIVKKGSVTYREAVNATKFCTKESLKFDAQRASVVAASAFGVSFVCNSAFLLFRGKSIKESLKSALFASTASAGKAFLVSMIAMQAQRTVLKSFLESAINFNFNGNFIGRGLAELGRRGAGAASKRVINSSANSVIRSNLVVAGATMLVTSGIEVTRMARGKISGMQCVKNIAVNATGVAGGMGGAMAGATIGTMLLPGIGTGVGAFVGGIAGGLAGTKLGKNIFGKWIEDDQVKIYRLFFWYIQYLALLFRMDEKEMQAFQIMIDNTIAQYGEQAFFKEIRAGAQQTLPHINAILKPMAVIVVSARPKVPAIIFDQAHAKEAGVALLKEMA
ncbi:hypothetical protein [Helicobacter felis]|uniref:hypothetical protein n=1 Tax=Helicobacter felis TaxID=214 RepID=UPI000CF051D9|nr:hypothetical protein [Helicobacter felis]